MATATKYLFLKPHDASLIDIFRVLFTEDMRDKHYVDQREVKPAILEGRGIIFLSMFLQKILRSGATPLSLLGSTTEMGLNLFGNKNNFGEFLSGLLRGKMKLPDKRLSNFVSIIGLLDKRVELDRKIKPGDSKYFAALTAMASKIAYENKTFIQNVVEKIWKMELLGAYDFFDERNQKYTTQGFMFHDKTTNPDTIVVTFRGTEPFNANDWITDLDISWFKSNSIKGRVHSGFMKALGLRFESPLRHCGAYSTITKELKRHFATNNRTRFIVTGHSLGGALAILFPAALVLHKDDSVLKRLEGVYTFGQPKVGDRKFGRFMDEQFKRFGVKYYRFVYSHDVVPRLPYDNSVLMYKHFGTCLYIDCFYERKDVNEELYEKHYFDIKLIVTRRVDALWELARSFILPRECGLEYKEGLLLKMCRLVGPVFPVIPPHNPLEYINATRLANY